MTLRDNLHSCEIGNALYVNHFSFKSGDTSYSGLAMSVQNVPGKICDVSPAGFPTGERLRVSPRSRCSDYISNLAWSRLCVEPADLSDIAVDREVS